jgi:hypothetical protein
MPPPEHSERVCFVITPIGDLNSETHSRSELVRTHIILPAAKATGYEEKNVIRADQIPQPGIITSQIIQHLYDDELVIADLTEHNPNVFYELAVRHATKKPVVMLIRKGERIPFDVAPNRAVQYDTSDWDSPGRCAEELAKQIQAVLNKPESADNPISAAMTFKALSESHDPVEQVAAALVPRLQALEFTIQDMQLKLDAFLPIATLTPPIGYATGGGANLVMESMLRYNPAIPGDHIRNSLRELAGLKPAPSPEKDPSEDR